MKEPAGLTVVEAAELLDLGSPRRVQQLVAEGWIAKAARGRYRLAPLVQGYIRFLRDSAKRTSDKAGDDELKAIRIEEARLDLEAKKHELVPTEDAIALVERSFGMLKAELTGVSKRITRDRAQRTRIEKEINDVLARAARRIAEHGAALRQGREDPDPDAEAES